MKISTSSCLAMALVGSSSHTMMSASAFMGSSVPQQPNEKANLFMSTQTPPEHAEGSTSLELAHEEEPPASSSEPESLIEVQEPDHTVAVVEEMEDLELDTIAEDADDDVDIEDIIVPGSVAKAKKDSSKQIAHLQKKLRYWKKEQIAKEADYKRYLAQHAIDHKTPPICVREGKIDHYRPRPVFDSETERIQTEVWTIKEQIKLVNAKLREERRIMEVRKETADKLEHHDAEVSRLMHQAKEDQEKIRLEAEARMQELQDQAKAEQEEIRETLESQAKEEQDRLRQEAEAEQEEIRETLQSQAKEEQDRLRQEAEAEQDRLRQEAEAKMQAVQDKAKQQQEQIREALKQEQEQIRLDANAKMKALKDKANNEQKQIRQEASAKMQELQEQSTERLTQKEEEIDTLATEIQNLIQTLEQKRSELQTKESDLASLETELEGKEAVLHTLERERASIRALVRQSWKVFKSRFKRKVLRRKDDTVEGEDVVVADVTIDAKEVEQESHTTETKVANGKVNGKVNGETKVLLP